MFPMHQPLFRPDLVHEPTLAQKLDIALGPATLPDVLEKMVSVGRWGWAIQTDQWTLSAGAAHLLDVEAGFHPTADSCLRQVVPEDVLPLMAALAQIAAADRVIECEFRVINEVDGLRWLRLVALPADPAGGGVLTGLVIDITAPRLAAMRERFSFESMQFLVGAQTLGETVMQAIQLVCENLGWEGGAYWAPEQAQMDEHRLVCQYHWHKPDYALAPFIQESQAFCLAPGEGLVGSVWSTMRAAWVEDMANDPDFLRRHSAQACGLQSGYAFPVSHVTADGRRHSHGVLEFYSCLSRQREAQLPSLSPVIGALIAQAAQRIRQQALIRQLSQLDDLTGLANRKHFQQLLDGACLRATASGSAFAVLNIDLDHFKPVNDAFGHEAGNVVLREFAQRLRELARAGCELGRLGGDEFAILVAPAGTRAELQALADCVLLAARQPFRMGEREFSVSASVGISVFPHNGKTGPELMRSSDAAMYRSKQNGRNGLCFFSDAAFQTLAQQRSVLVQHLTLEAELHQALQQQEFFLEYQPIFDLNGERMEALEALIRWRRPDGETVRPDVFIPVAEQSRLIVQIGRWVVRQACRDLARLQRAGFPDVQVHVNMAAQEFVNATLPEELLAEVQACGVAPHHLCLELTEGTVMQQPDKVIPVMTALRQLGFKISLDDFGMGHSSLSRMKELPVTSLKIDRSFVRGLPHDRGDGAIVRTILALGRHMHLQVIAEGVENDAQLGFLHQFGCHLIQGFALGRPQTVARLIELQPPLACQTKTP